MSAPTAEMSLREKEVAQLAATGLTNKEIGARLYLSEFTVKTHLARIFTKTGVKSRAALATVFLSDLRFLIPAEVGALLARAKHDLEKNDRNPWGSADYYRNQGAIAMLEQLVRQLGTLGTDGTPR